MVSDVVQIDRWHLKESQKAKVKMQNDRAKMKKTVNYKAECWKLVHWDFNSEIALSLPLLAMTERDGIAKLSSGETKIEILNNVKWPRQFWVLNLDIGICLGFSALSLGFPLRGVSASCFASGFCSCLIHQAQLPNKLGNYIFKLRLATTEKGESLRDPYLSLRDPYLSLRAKRSNLGKAKLKNQRANWGRFLHFNLSFWLFMFDFWYCSEFSAWDLELQPEIASSLSLLAMTEGEG